MFHTPSSLSQAAKAAGLTALILGLTLSAGTSSAAAQLSGHPVAPIASDNDETTCDPATEAALAAAEQTLEAAYHTDQRALEQLREKAGDHNAAARDLLHKAAGDLKRAFNTAAAAIDAAADGTCASFDPAALDATVAAAIAAMDQVVTDATAAVAALPADQAKSNDGDEEDDD